MTKKKYESAKPHLKVGIVRGSCGVLNLPLNVTNISAEAFAQAGIEIIPVKEGELPVPREAEREMPKWGILV